MRWGFFFFLSFFLFLLVTFQNHWNLFWVYLYGNFLSGKSISRREKNQEKWRCPLWKTVLVRPCSSALYLSYHLRALVNPSRSWSMWTTSKRANCVWGSEKKKKNENGRAVPAMSFYNHILPYYSEDQQMVVIDIPW